MLNFPDPPLTTGQTFQSGATIWRWDGTKWVVNTGSTTVMAVVPVVTATFTTPAIGSIVVVSVSDASWMVVNAQLFIVDAYYNINGISGTTLTLQRTA